MSEHSRYPRDRSASRDRDQTGSERFRETRTPHDHERWYDNDAARRTSDRNTTYRSDTHYNGPHSFDSDRVEPTFGTNPPGHSERNHAEGNHTRHNGPMHYEHSASSLEEQDVWMREKQSRITFNDSDLEDIQFTERSERVRKLAAYCGVVAMTGLIVFLGFSSTPDLSPQEIIAAEGYEGEQPTKTPFNLASLHDCEPGTACAKALESTVTPVTVTATTVIAPATQPSTTIVTQSTTTTGNTLIEADVLLTDRSAGNVQILEIAAADQRLAASTLPTTNPEASLYDRLTVLQQWSNVRGSPDINGEILAALAVGKIVTKLGETGQWIEVQIDERPSVTGYMHRSTIEPQ